ncbi:MAG: ABC transporter ATP-binding protein [Phycisphaerales bacterium]|nr:ABC transporter ATP-binding protein [Phycisphaerales bacterium]
MNEQDLPVLQTVGLTKVFKDFWRRDRVAAVNDLNLTVERGQVFGLLGPNGSGKSTTIKMLLGLLFPTRGRVSLFGRPPTDVATKSRIGFLPEESYLYRFLDARETLDLYGRLFRLHSRQRAERIEKLLEMVGLQAEAKRRIGEYSKGMARRIGLAQALINDPEFLILDEPTSGMDPLGTRQIKDVIRQLASRGKTILLSSHLLADVEDVCDRVTILYGGRQQAAGTIRELLAQADRTQIIAPRLSAETIAQVRALVRRLEQKDLLSVGAPHDRLENLFMKTVEAAQAANVRSAGVRAGGELPDFLSTGGRMPDLIESLVARADHPAAGGGAGPAAPISAPPRPRTDRSVIEQLTHVGGSIAPKESTTPAPPNEAPQSSRTPRAEPKPPRAQRSDIDRSVIDGLISRPGESDGE